MNGAQTAILADMNAIPTPPADMLPSAMGDPDAMTILVALDTGNGQPVMTKSWSQGEHGVESKPYDNGYLFKVLIVSAATFVLLTAFLTWLKSQRHACVIRGRLLPHANPHRTTRCCRDKEGMPASFAECLRRWILLDCDDFKLEDFPNPITDPEGCIAAIRARLPAGLRDVACFWSFSSSTGMRPEKLGVHLWLLLETALGWRDAEAFIAACGADVAVSRTVQVHYTATPLFIPPLADPLPMRYGTLPGIERVSASVVAALVAEGRLKVKPVPAVRTVRPSRQQSVGTPTIERAARAPSLTPSPANPTSREPAPGMIGEGFRHRHLQSIAGFVRSRDVDAAGLHDVLLAENEHHFDPPLAESVPKAMARSYAAYPSDPSKMRGTLWERAIALAAGLYRHGACRECMIAGAAWLLGHKEIAQRMVDELLAKPDWEIGIAESIPVQVIGANDLDAEILP